MALAMLGGGRGRAGGGELLAEGGEWTRCLCRIKLRRSKKASWRLQNHSESGASWVPDPQLLP